MNSSIINLIKKKIYFNPRTTNKILEDISAEHNIDVDTIIEHFIEEEQVHPTIYASLLDEAINKIDEDLTGFIKNKLGAASDALLTKYGFGSLKLKAQGNSERRERTDFLLNNWIRLSAQAKLQATPANIKTYLLALKLDPIVINKAISLNSSTWGKNNFRNLFDSVAELEQQNALKKLAGQVAAPRKPKQAQVAPATNNPNVTVAKPAISQQDIENYISKLPPADRAQFVTNNILPKLSDVDVQNIVKSLLAK